MSVKTLLGLLAIGLIPAGVAMLLAWPLGDDSGRAIKQTADAVAGLEKQVDSLRGQLEVVRKEQQDSRARLAAAERELELRHGRRKLISGMLPLVRGKSMDDVSGDEDITKKMAALAGPFDQIALLDSGSGKVLLSTFATSGAEAKEQTAKISALVKAKKKPPLTEPGWHLAPIGPTGFVAAFNIKQGPKPAAGALGQPANFPDKPQTDLLTEFGRQTTRRITVLSVVLPLAGLLLSLLMFVYLRKKLLAPLVDATRLARGTIENPSGVEPEACRVGLLEDLYASLDRLRQRVLRLGQLDAQAAERRTDIMLLSRVIDRAGRGDTEIRAESSTGELAEFSVLTNRMLDRFAERSQAMRRAAAQLDDSTARLSKLGNRLADSLDEELPNPADSGVIADILGSGFDALNRTAEVIAKSSASSASGSVDAAERAAIGEQLQSASAGLQMLLQKTGRGAKILAQLDSLRRESELLSTNMAIAAETRSWTSLEKLSVSAKTLSTTVDEIHRKFEQQLDQTVPLGGKLDASLGQAARGITRLLDSLEGWDETRADLNRHGQNMIERLGQMRPLSGSLGSSIRSINEQLARCRKLLTERLEALRGLVETSSAVGRLANEIQQLCEQSLPRQPVPGAPSRDLAATQKALEQAMQELTDVAAQEGIEAFSGDASRILDKIRAYAGLARQKIASADVQPAANGAPDEEAGA